jgi:aspartyl/asparaginyl beta-hydroxylase (cupin superfamily)
MDEDAQRELLRKIDFPAVVARLRAAHPPAEVDRIARWLCEDLPSQLAGAPVRAPRDQRMQPRLFYLSGLDEPAWWDPALFECTKILEEAWPKIHDEVRALMAETWSPYSPQVRGWTAYHFYDVRGRQHDDHIARCPETWRVVSSLPRARNVYFSRLAPGTFIAPHHGPTNASLVGHLGVVVPPGDCKLEVAGGAREWTAGKCMIFDDTYLHAAWNKTPYDRVVLLFGVWHPALTPLERVVLGGRL